jgi:hypothetical protein
VSVVRLDDIAVVVTCHEPYLLWLPEALASVDRQLPAPAERVVAFDGCAPAPVLPDGWRCVTGRWGRPSGPRDAGLTATTASWVTFLDADNVMPAGYLAAAATVIASADAQVGIVYPDIDYVDEWLNPRRRWTMPSYAYWELRRQNIIDTASVWRRAALEVVGGWPAPPFLQDYLLALLITAAGWTATPLRGPPIVIREHSRDRLTTRRLREGSTLTHIWRARSLAIVSLMAGRAALLDRWTRFLLEAELPPRTALYVLDNGGDARFSARLREAALTVAAQRGLTHVDIAAAGAPYVGQTGERYLTKARHLHIASLYAATLPRVREDLVFTLEDDVEPDAGAIRLLGEDIGHPARANIGASAGAYSSPSSPSHVCAASGFDGWTGAIPWAQLPFSPVDVGFVGGGATMWANWALHECTPHLEWRRTLGWDGVLCNALRARGYTVRLHGGVRCAHHRFSPAPAAPTEAPLLTPRRPPPPVASPRTSHPCRP